MGIIELVLIAVGLSMDAFAVALCKGLCMKKLQMKDTMIIALFFGGFQALMPLLGWLLGVRFQAYITQIDHWIAFVLLGVIGGRMVYGAVKDEEENVCKTDGLNLKEVFLLAIATSIDALAVGITFAFLNTAILPSVTLIGLITFGLSFAGVLIGHRFGTKFKKKAEIAGGAVLVLIGLKILLEHTGILVF